MVELTDFYNYMDNTKPFWKSWTIWLNVGLLLLEFINSLGQYVPVPPGVLAMTGNLANIILRFKTSQPIE